MRNAVRRNKARRQVRSILREIYKENIIYGKFALIFTKQFVDSSFEEKRDRLNRILQGASVKQNRIFLIKRLYQPLLSPIVGNSCRFTRRVPIMVFKFLKSIHL